MPSPKRERIAMVVVLASIVAATGLQFRNGLVWDDLYSIEQGDVLHDFAHAGRVFAHPTLYATTFYEESEQRSVDTYRPVTLLTFMVDSALTGRRPLAYHATNLLGHLLAVLLVFVLARRMLPPARAKYAPFAAAWFGLSPLLAEAHVWINGRSDVFCAIFGLSAVLVWRRAADRTDEPGARRVGWLALAGLLFLLAALSKEVILLAWPALVLWPRRSAGDAPAGLGPSRGRWRSHLGELVPFAVASAVYAAMRIGAIGGVRATGEGDQLVTALRQLPVLWLDGLTQSVAPSRVYVRSMVDDYAIFGPVALAGFALLVVVIAGLLVRGRRRAPLLAWSLLWFACTLAPAAMISTVLWPGFGRYLYVPMAGLVVGLTDLGGRLLEWRPRAARLFRVLAVLYLLVLGVRLAAFTLDFESDDTLFSAVIRQDPEAHHGPGWLGTMRYERGRSAAAIGPLRRASELAPSQLRYLEMLGSAYYHVHDCPRVLEVADVGVSHFTPAGSFHMLAVNCLNGTDPIATTRHLLRCLEDEPDRADCSAALAHATHQHVLAAEYREVVAQMVREDRYRAIRGRVAALLGAP